MAQCQFGKNQPVPSTSGWKFTANARAIFNSKVIAPAFVRYNTPATIFIEYSNTGDLAMPAPLIELSGIQNTQRKALLTLDDTLSNKAFATSVLPDGFHNTLRLLASGATPGTLQPGESVRLPVYYGGWQQPWNFSYPAIRFELRILHHDNPTLIDWTGRFAPRLPGEIDPGWNEIMGNLRTSLGETWGQYVLSLGRTSRELYLDYGAEIQDVTELDFHILRSVPTGPPGPEPAPMPDPQEPPSPAPTSVTQPGTVFKYAGGWVETTPDESLNASADTFVIIHGWNDAVVGKGVWQANMASALAGRNPGANILAVDWSAWSVKWTPFEPTYYIPLVADRLAWRLFASKGASMPNVWRKSDWLNPPTVDDRLKYGAGVIGLGLDPARTYFIGHSHGAHVSGLAAEYARPQFGTVKRVTALDPSCELSHMSVHNLGGKGWGNIDKRSAHYIDSYRSSKGGPWYRTYGDDNFLLALDGYLYDDSRLDDGGKHSWAHQWFTLTIHNGGALRLGYDWATRKVGGNCLKPSTIQCYERTLEGTYTGQSA